MNSQITMPSLGADMTEGKLLNWRIKVGDHIKKGQVVADIETQKAAVEMESFAEGVVTSLKASPQDIIPVGSVMAELLPEELGAEINKTSTSRRATPAAKKLAEDNQLDWHDIQGTGSLGTVELKDVQSVLSKLNSAKTSSEAESPKTSLINMRTAITKAMTKSKSEIPHYYLKTSVAIDSLLEKLDELNQKNSSAERILLAAVIAKLVATTLKDFPELNGFYIDNQYTPAPDVNLGIAISLKRDGLITPCLFGGATKSLPELSNDFNNLVLRARTQGLRSSELSQATFTITNLGDLGAEEVFGIIFPPQVALLGVGCLHQKPIIKSGQITVGHELILTLSGDHRVSDGLLGSRFLQSLKLKMETGIWD